MRRTGTVEAHVGNAAVELTVDGPGGPRIVPVSHPDKVYFPALGVTKLDVVRYFLAVGDGILAALRKRPTMLERWPGGVSPGAEPIVGQGERGGGFYQRRVPRDAPDWVETGRTGSTGGPYDDWVCPTEIAVVVWAANLGTLTFHPDPVRRSDVDHPDQLRIDLDPQPGTDFHDAVRVAVELRGVLDEVGMVGFPKTSGKRGLHVYVPIEQRWTFAEVRRGLIALGRELVRRLPDDVTMMWSKQERGQRVYFDYDRTAIASAYSIRPTPHAHVSAPLTWEELTQVSPGDFDVTTMPARFGDVGDLHAGLADHRFSIEPLLEMADRDERDGGGGDPRRGRG